MTALWGEAALFIPGHECNSLLIVAPSDFDRLIQGYRLTQTALSGDPYYCRIYFGRGLSVDAVFIR